MSGTPYRPPSFLGDAWRIARKDLLIEFRTRSAFLAATVFAVLAVVIFRFTWDPTAIPAIDLAPGVLWVIFTFSGLLGLNRSFGLELAERAYDGLLASQVSRESIFTGKVLANLAFVAGVQALTLPAVALFFDLPVGAAWGTLIGIVVLAALGLAAVGTLFAAIAANTRLAELLLPMMTLPFFVPLVIPAAQASAVVLRGQPVGDAMAWLKVLLAFDLVFVTACIVVFPYTIEE
ncbi:MAG: heme exporter protein CcmB [Gemmatimonas sp.]|uniref:heme exporter protein CcmB n=1 Tax=Gemmatimonas sp. TaxID=1962908 RepID=UPI00391F6DBF|nr:heme exporter protein CcmB [Gemmatimonadota bacterium]